MYLAIFLILSLFASSAECEQAGPKPYPIMQRGMCYATWDKSSYLSTSSDKSLESMRSSGIASVAIVTTWYQEAFDSVHIMPTDKTPSDRSLRHAIEKAHKLGMSVMLKPHVDLLNQSDSHWRADIGFQSEDQWEKWFKNYTNFLSHYAKLAEKEGVEFFCIGTELSFAVTKTNYWREKIIPEIRKVFSGQITYAANWDDYRDVGFWDLLDYAGIDAYFPLSYKKNPTYRDIREGWKKWLHEIEAWQASVNRPVVFTECGYSSADIAASNPWETAMSGEPNLRIQRNCYRAVFETFWNKKWFWGVYWWNWNTSPNSGGPNNRRFTPQNKPALREVSMRYAALTDKDAPLGTSASAFNGFERVSPLSINLQPSLPAASHLAVEPLKDRLKMEEKE